MTGFPIDRSSDREFSADWRGTIVTCDIDRTYLMTRFSSAKSLARIPFEFGIDKQAIAGMPTLLKELRRGPGQTSRHTPLFFVSASPSQLRPIIQRKMLLDRLDFDGTTFKKWGAVARSLRFKRFREQVGFKLTAMLTARLDFPVGADEVVIGDDLESDAIAFSLYAQVLRGEFRDAQLTERLSDEGVAPDDAAHIVDLASRVGANAGLRRILIRVERSHPGAFLDFAPDVVAGLDALQLAASLVEDECISPQGFVRVVGALVQAGKKPVDLRARLEDCVGRAVIAPDRAETLRTLLVEAGHFEARWRLTEPVHPDWYEAMNRDW